MKIKIIEPVIQTENTNQTNFDKIYIQKCLGSEVEYEIEYIDHGLESIESLTEKYLNIPDILKKVSKVNENEYDGIFINCFDDPGVVAAHEITSLPIFGAFLPAITFASCIGQQITILTTSLKGKPSLEHLIRESNVSKYIQKIHYLDEGVLDLAQKEKILDKIFQLCKKLHQNGSIDTVILGCTAMSYLVDDLRILLSENDIYLQIIEPKMVGLKLLKMTIEMGLNNSFLTPSNRDFFFNKT
ncbi:MAG: aspartate/glutamate racemase family protein [Promethearchaeota archaeon]